MKKMWALVLAVWMVSLNMMAVAEEGGHIMAELIFNGFLLIFFIAMFFYSTQITIWEGDVWARYWPMMILALAIIIFTMVDCIMKLDT